MTYSSSEIKWNQWLAGVIDGDGYLAIQKSNNIAVCEITMGLEDEYLLAQIKQKLGGYIRLRSGARAVRYRLSTQTGMINLLNRINGFCYNSIRIEQLKKLCKKFSIDYIHPCPLTIDSAYTAGFFDADGTIYMAVSSKTCPNEFKNQKGLIGKIHRLQYSRGGNQLCISITNKYKENLEIFQNAFKIGYIYEKKNKRSKQRSQKWHVWEIKNPDHILQFLDYTRMIPFRSNKAKKFFLIERYFELKRINAHLSLPGTKLHKAWYFFSKKWYLG